MSSAAAPSASAVAAARCADAPGGLLVGEATAPVPRASDAEEGEDLGEIGLPFAVQLGGAAHAGDYFVASALLDRKGESHAVLVVLSAAGVARTVDLGRVFGDVVPPVVQASGARILAAYMDGAPAGKTLRIVAVDGAPDAPEVKPGATVSLSDDDSPAFGLALSSATALVVWEEFDDDKNRSFIQASHFAPETPNVLSEPLRLSGEKADAESPRAVRASDGYLVAWIENEASAKAPPRDDPERTVDHGPRFLSLLKLSEQGAPVGAPVRVTGAGAHVLSFDIAATDDQGAIVVWREDTTSPDLAGGAVRLARVLPDGSVEARTLADQDVGATVPTLLVDRGLSGKARGFVAFAGDDDTTRFGAVDAAGATLGSIEVEPKLFGAAPLAAHAGKVLAARPRGRGAELFILSCRAE